MERLLSIGLSNALAAAALAVLAALACRAWRRPALAHALWLLVLLKLLTPPVWTVPVAGLPPAREAPVPPVPEARDEGVVLLTDEQVRWLEQQGGLEVVEVPSTAGPVEPQPEPASPTTRAFPWRPVKLALAALWLGGSVAYLVVAAVRVRQFRRVLAHAGRACAEVQSRAEAIARRLGLPSCPGVWFVPGAVCPMLWAAGGPARLLVPSGLWGRLDDRQRDTLLAHELAHLKRRDHWVRLLELLATALYWWHPAVWWARHELREAEEQCCDAWVVWSLPGSARHYMTALLEAVEFVSERLQTSGRFAASAPPPPALASGMGQFQHLKRRLTMMKQVNVTKTRSLSWAAFAAVCGAAALLLPLAPTLAQSQDEPAQPDGSAAAPAEEKVEDVTVEVRAEPADEPSVELSADVIDFVAARLDGAAVEAAGDVLVTVPEGTVLGEVVLDSVPTITADAADDLTLSVRSAYKASDAAEVERARAEVAQLTARLEAARQRLAALEGGKKGEYVARRVVTAKKPAVVTHRVEVRGGEPRKAATVARRPGSADAKDSEESAPGFVFSDGKAAAPAQDPNARLDALEQKLEALLNEVKQLKGGERQGGGEGKPRLR